MLFIKHMDFYLSLSEWMLLPMKRIDKYQGYLAGLTVNLRVVIHKNSTTSDIVKTEVNSMLDAIALLKRQTDGFKQSINQSRRRRDVSNRRMPLVGSRGSPQPVAQACDPRSGVNLCETSTLFLPVFIPDQPNAVSLQMVQWLKVFYRRMERMIASDVHNATKVYHPSEMFPAPPPKG